MIQHFLPITQNVTLLGGGEVTPENLSECLTRAPDLVAADGGADLALGFGQRPLAVVGDMDSVSDRAREALGAQAFYETPDQDRTDFDKALSLIEAPLILGLGFMGKRMDHTLAAFNTLIRQPDKPVILVGESDIVFHLSRPLDITLPKDSAFALFPMAKCRVTSTGLKWPATGMEMAPWARIGTSNIVTGPRVSVQTDGPGMLVIVPRTHLDAVIAAVTAATAVS
ncbi:thiamine diphosphokinase [Aliiroseovarius marinus]|uniref:thiamine diphosphokinase n=1 Tax=Aliiroseovarius marinus TaxID=2500159 RepID=UPI003D7C894C